MGKKHQVEPKTEEDVTFDFSWFKKIFSKPDKKIEQKNPDEDIGLDFGKLYKEISKYSVFLLILIPLILSIYIRTAPERMQIADEWAKQGIYNGIKNNIASSVQQQYPNLPQQNMQALIDEQFNLVLSQQGVQIEQAITSQAEQIRQRFRDDSGYTYLGDIDSYYWLRYTKNLVEKGHIGDEVRNGIQYDNHMFAPIGKSADNTIYPYLEAYLYKFLRFFQQKITLMQAAFYTPLFLSFFAIIAAFLIGKKLSGNLAGLIAAILIAVNPTILSRSLGSDNDIVNAVFPLLIMLFIIYAFDAKDIKKMIIYTAISGIILGIYSFAWTGWWFMFLFIIAAAITYLGYVIIYDFINHTKRINIRNPHIVTTLLFLVVFFGSTTISLSFFGNQSAVLASFSNPIEITRLKEASKGIDLWPNVYTTVAELNEADVSQIVQSLGGNIFLWISLIGTILPLFTLKSEKKHFELAYYIFSAVYFLIFVNILSTNQLSLIFMLAMLSLPLFLGLLFSIFTGSKIDPKHSILMVIWFIATIYAATKGVRFILLIVPAFVISFSLFFGLITEWLSRFIGKTLDVNTAISKSILIILSLLVLYQPIRTGFATGYNYIPSVNDAWVDTLTRIKNDSPPNAIINSWWDFGHWFKFFSDRAVTFDGASQNNQQAHWIGKVLLTDDEKQAISIIRMLDCGANKVFEKLNQQVNDTHLSVNILTNLLGKSREDAKKELLKVTNQQTADEILSTLFCTPPEDYFITSEDMVGKSGVWAHFGIWDFERSEMYNYYKSLNYDEFVSRMQKEYNYTKDQAQKTYYELSSLTTDRQVNDWISPWPSYGGMATCTNEKENLLCNIQMQNNQVIPLQINMTSKEAFVTAKQDTYYPNNFGYIEDNSFKMKNYNENQLGYGVVLLADNRTVVLMAEQLTGSMFTRLFYLEGIGLKNFKKFYDIIDITGARIITWKIDWEPE